MALILSDSFDLYAENDYSAYWTQGPWSGGNAYYNTGAFSYGSTSSVTRFGVGKSFYFGSTFGAGAYKVFPSNTSTVYLAFAINMQTASRFRLYQAGTLQCYVGFDPVGGGMWVQNNAGTVLGSYAAGMFANTWYHVQLKIVLAGGTGGSVTFRKNGNTADDWVLSGISTISTSNAWADVFQLEGSSPLNYLEDMLIFDNTGTTFNGFVGDIRCYTLFPSGGGSAAQFTPVGAAANYIAAQTFDGDTSYNKSVNVGDTDLFQMDNLPVSPTSILAVNTKVVGRKNDAYPRMLQTQMKSNGNVYNGTSTFLGSGYSGFTSNYYVNPSTGIAWSASDVNSLELGYKVSG